MKGGLLLSLLAMSVLVLTPTWAMSLTTIYLSPSVGSWYNDLLDGLQGGASSYVIVLEAGATFEYAGESVFFFNDVPCPSCFSENVYTEIIGNGATFTLSGGVFGWVVSGTLAITNMTFVDGGGTTDILTVSPYASLTINDSAFKTCSRILQAHSFVALNRVTVYERHSDLIYAFWFVSSFAIDSLNITDYTTGSDAIISATGASLFSGNITNSHFVNNWGKSVWASSANFALTINNTVFLGNSADCAVTVSGGRAVLSNVSFVDNTAMFTPHPGALLVESGSAYVLNSTFIGNSGFNGGAVLVDTTSQTFALVQSAFVDCHFELNRAIVNGGAVYVSGLEAAGLQFGGCDFVNNSAYNGGGGAVMYYYGLGGAGFLEFTRSMFLSNSAKDNGGAISTGFGARMNIETSLFFLNSAPLGGAVSVFDSYEGWVTSAVFQGNSATSIGGALLCFSSECHVSSTVMIGNSASSGAAVYALFTGTSVTLDYVAVTGHGRDAIVAFLADSLTATNTVVFDNGGGGFVIVESDFVHTNGIVMRNGGRAAISVASSGTLAIEGSFIADNAGFGLGCDGGSLSISASVLCQNEDGQLSGGDSCAINVLGEGPDYGNDAVLCQPLCEQMSYFVPNMDPLGDAAFAGPFLGCHTAASPCVLDPTVCSAFADCEDAVDSTYTCACPSGFTGGGTPSDPCQDINECDPVDPCLGGASCNNTQGSFTCECGAGYSSLNGTCVNNNECLVEGTCGGGAECLDNDGSFECSCPSNWYGDAAVNCTQCPGASYLEDGQPNLSLTDCKCLPSYFTDPVNFPGFCVPCPPGFYIVGATCLPCPVHFYNDLPSRTICSSCGYRRTAPIGSDSFDDCVCLPGYVEDGSGACAANCTLGEYRPSVTSSCVTCGVDTYADVPNLLTCLDCPPFSTTNGSDGQVSMDVCMCQANFTWIDAGDLSRGCARECPPGTFHPVADAPCIDCPVDTYNELPNQFGCSLCPLNSNSNGVTGATSPTVCVCDEGFAGSPICLRQCPPGTRYQNEASPCEPCPPNTYNPDVRAPECLACPENAICGGNSTALTDCTCAPGFYTPERVAGTPCLPCPEGGTCLGGVAYPIADYGYAPVEGEDGIASFAECVPESACLGNGACQVGYTGSLCEACDSDVEGTPYYRLSGNCVKCRQNPGLVVFALYAFLFVVQCLIVAVNSQDRVLNRFASLVIGLNSLQITAQYGRLDVEWPPLAQKFFDILSIANFNIELVAPECAVPVGDPFVLRWMATMFFPILLLFNFFVIWVAFCGFHFVAHKVSYFSANFLMSLQTIKAARHTAIRSMYQIMMIAYLPLSAAVFELFDCPRNGYGQRVIQTSRSTQCYEGVYWVLFPFGLFFLLLYPIGMPIFYYNLLKMKLANLGNIKFHVRYGFLVGRFSPDYYLFELAIMIRKLLVVLCMSFLTKSAFIKAGGAIIVLLASYLVHQETLPYRSVLYNGMESACIFCAILILLLSMLFDDPSFSEGAKSGLIVMVLLINLLVIFVGIVLDSRRLARELEEAEGIVTKADDEYDNAVGMKEEDFNQIALTEITSAVVAPERSYATVNDPNVGTIKYASSSTS